jgi:hypothetical protein
MIKVKNTYISTEEDEDKKHAGPTLCRGSGHTTHVTSRSRTGARARSRACALAASTLGGGHRGNLAG